MARWVPGRWRRAWWSLACLLLCLPGSLVAAPPVAALYPLATRDGDRWTGADLAIEAGLLVSKRYQLLDAAPPPDYDPACVRSYFCLKRLATTQDVDRLVVGLAEPEGGQIKVYLVLFDARALTTLKAVEARMPRSALGTRLPDLVGQLVADEPMPPPPAPPPPVAAAPAPAQPPEADVAEAMRRRAEAERSRAEQASAPVTAMGAGEEADFADALADATRPAAPPPAVQVAVRAGGAWLVGRPLLVSGAELDLTLRRRLVLGLSAEQLNGYDQELATAFFLVSGTLSADVLLGQRAVHPLAGVEARAIMLAPQLTSVGGSLRGGAHVDLTRTLALRGIVLLGLQYDPILPDTVFELRATQVWSGAQVQLAFTL